MQHLFGDRWAAAAQQSMGTHSLSTRRYHLVFAGRVGNSVIPERPIDSPEQVQTGGSDITEPEIGNVSR